LLLSAFLFVPANTLAFPRAWAFLAVYFLPQIWMLAYFLRIDPNFIERRLKMGPRRIQNAPETGHVTCAPVFLHIRDHCGLRSPV
jgi:hypothetical protein